jgi:hypothetical protein
LLDASSVHEKGAEASSAPFLLPDEKQRPLNQKQWLVKLLLDEI